MRLSPPDRVFSYLTAPQAEAYREVMAVFVRAKDRFRLHLRPEEVFEALRSNPWAQAAEEPLDPSRVDHWLGSLVDWGNLVAHADGSEVRTVEDFYRHRFLFQLSRHGEAAEQAIRHYRELIERPGELQTHALGDIRAGLEELAGELAAPAPDLGRIQRVLTGLFARFDELAEQARAFIGGIQRSIDLQGSDLEAFLAYKEHLIEYLDQFIAELTLSTADIAQCLAELDRAGVAAILEAVADRVSSDALDPSDDDRARQRDHWHDRWEGVRGWFVGAAETPSQARQLRACARSAIPALLAALAGFNERRIQRSDRVADLRELARWFACGTDTEAHRLWRAAFGLTPARHLTVDADTLDHREACPAPPELSWLDDEPLRITPRLRATGRLRKRGRPAPVIDRTAEKAALRGWAEQEAAQLAVARRRLATGETTRLSQFARLDRRAFHLFLDVLGAALARKGDPNETVTCTSSDGSLVIHLQPIPEAPWITLDTEDGAFHGPDHAITISDAFAPAEAARGAA